MEFRELWFNLQQRDQLKVSRLVQESRVVGISKQGCHARFHYRVYRGHWMGVLRTVNNSRSHEVFGKGFQIISLLDPRGY